MALLEYQKVLSHLKKQNRQHHLLLGNGFSMAYDPDIFSYNALHKYIDEIEDDLLSKLFGIVKTKNFELVMQQLDNFCELIEVFGSDKELLDKVKTASETLKQTLMEAIESLHPEHVFKISDEECEKCAQFLLPFFGCKGQIFTTNYDILLYWVLMRSTIKNPIDGFGRDREDDEEDFETDPVYSELRWGKHKELQNVHYLHGALPFFDTGIDVIKEEYDATGYLMEHIKRRLEAKQYPIFVAAGDGGEKLNHIMHNQYLSFCYEELTQIQGSLITFGFNFGPYDEHIINAINIAAKQGRKVADKLWSVYIGVYSEEDEKHIESIKGKFKCKVNKFDVKTVAVWR